MAADRESGGLFASEDDLVLVDELADVFEPDRSLDDAATVFRSDAIDEVRRRDRPGDVSIPRPRLDQVIDEKCEDIVGGDERSVAIDDAEPVAVTVG